MNRKDYINKFGATKVSTRKQNKSAKRKNKKCKYKDCGYCLKYNTKCFNCHTND